MRSRPLVYRASRETIICAKARRHGEMLSADRSLANTIGDIKADAVSDFRLFMPSEWNLLRAPAPGLPESLHIHDGIYHYRAHLEFISLSKQRARESMPTAS